MQHAPALLSALDSEHRVSSKWIAKETGKQLQHVHRDIEALQREDGPELDHAKDSRGYVTEYVLPLSFAVMLLSRYNGPRAVAARRLVVAALEYFIHRAPFVEQRLRETDEDNLRLRLENQALSQNQKSLRSSKSRQPSTKRYDTVALTAKLFGLPFVRVKLGLQEMTPFQRLMASVIHDMRVSRGFENAIQDKTIAAAEDFQGRFAYEELKDRLGDMTKFMFELALSVVEGEDADKDNSCSTPPTSTPPS